MIWKLWASSERRPTPAPHPPHQFPGHALACALYLEGGIRTVECGSLYLGKEDEQGNPLLSAPWELVRLAIPRRVYDQGHIEHVGRTLARVAENAAHLPGYRITEPAPVLRHFRSKLAPVPPPLTRSPRPAPPEPNVCT